MTTKLIHFAKMSWMFAWRLALITGLISGSQVNLGLSLALALITAGVIVFAFNKALLTWPIARLILRRRFIIPAGSWGSDAATAPKRPVHQGHVHYSKRRDTAPVTLPQVQTATRNGRMTGYEPRALEGRSVPRFPTMVGVPGSGLHSAAGMAQENINLGVAGEEAFARALAVSGQLGRFSTIWSLPVPDKDRLVPGPYSTDIDCVLSTGSTVFLVDLKNYKSGDVRYYARGDYLYCEDVATGQQVGDPKLMSRNMEMAASVVRGHFPNVHVVPIVVFMPTDKGEGVLDGVVWPGNIPAVNLTDFLAMLKEQPDFAWGLPHSGAVGRLANLLPGR